MVNLLMASNSEHVRERGLHATSSALFDDPRAGRTDEKRNNFAMLDLWRVHLQQCPECGRVHGSEPSGGFSGRPERHIYEYLDGAGAHGMVSEDLLCALCGEVFQSPTLAPCGHHFCHHCLRMLLTRTAARAAGRAACPVDGQTFTRFALRPAEQNLLDKLDDLWVRCPVCRDEVRKGDLHLHLQDPVHMVEDPRAYEAILRPFYMSCPLSKFTVGELNGSSSLIRFYRQLGEKTLKRFVLATDAFLMLPDPKMGYQPHSDEDFRTICTMGGYFNAYWIHPRFRRETWWRKAEPSDEASSTPGSEHLEHLVTGQDCSSEPWHASSFVHTWSSVRKPSSPRYLCCLRDLCGEDLQILETLQRDVWAFLSENYGVEKENVSIFSHYPNSARYSTLHFHIIFGGSSGSRYEKYSKKLERPHQLSRQFALQHIIDRLRSNPSHYQQCVLKYFLGDKADLMDPISAFFKCSPHKYMKDFTFNWDPDAIVGQNSLAENPATQSCQHGVTPPGSPDRHNFMPSTAPEARHLHDAVTLQITELQRSVDSLGQTMTQLQRVVQDISRHQEVEAAGAARTVLAQLASLPAASNQADPCTRVVTAEGTASSWPVAAMWALTGALAGGCLVGLALASAPRLRHWR